MIKVFNSLATSFYTGAELFIKDVIEVKENKKKSSNGWSISVRLPLKYASFIAKDKIIAIKTKSKANPQGFRIGPEIESDDYEIRFIADHVMYDAKRYLLIDVRPENKSGVDALIWCNERTAKTSPFTFTGDVTNINTAYFSKKTLFEAMQTIEEQWGGVFDADNFNISFNQHIGNDNGISILYGKNLQSKNTIEDWADVCTRIYPEGPNGLTLPEEYLDSDIQYADQPPFDKLITFESDLPDDATDEDKINELRSKAQEYLDLHKYPMVQYSIESNIEQSLDIGDTVYVKYPNVDLQTEIQEYTYNPMTKMLEDTIFGNYTKDVKKSFSNIKQNISILIEKMSSQESITKNQTALLNYLNKNGYTYITENEIMFLDNLPKEDAVNVLGIGNGGIGFSNNGCDGPFIYAWTIDGTFNTDFIKANTISTDKIIGLNQIIESIDKVVNLEKDIVGQHTISILGAAKGPLKYLSIRGEMELVFPGNDLFFDDNLLLLDSYLIVDTSPVLTENAVKYFLPINYLRKLGDISDELIIDAEGNCSVIRRVGADASNNYYLLEDEVIESLGTINIEFSKGDYYLYLESFQDSNTITLETKYIASNAYTEEFASKVELNAKIALSALSIMLEVAKKVGNNEVISRINQTAEEIKIQADKIAFEGHTFNLATDNINITSDNLDINNDGINLKNGAKLIGGDGVLNVLQFKSSGSYSTSYSKVGFVQYVEQVGFTDIVEYDDTFVDVYIPANFVITSAIITLSHTPIYWSDPASGNPVTGYSRNVKIYKLATGKSYKIDNFNALLNVNQSDLTEIVNALGVSAYTPSNTTLGTVEEKDGIDIKSYLAVGHNVLVAQSGDAKPSINSSNLALKTGGVIMTVNIKGYMTN